MHTFRVTNLDRWCQEVLVAEHLPLEAVDARPGHINGVEAGCVSDRTTSQVTVLADKEDQGRRDRCVGYPV